MKAASAPPSLGALREQREAILAAAARHGALDLRVFGSVARGEARSDSDVDFLARLEPERSLFDRIALKQELEDLLGREVDLVHPDHVFWALRERVLREAVPL